MSEPRESTDSWGPIEPGPIEPGVRPSRALRASWAHRPIAVERVRISNLYARFYAPLAVLCTLLAVMPIFTDVTRFGGEPVRTESYGSVAGGDITGFVVITQGALAVLLIVASFRASSSVLPLVMAAVAGILVVLLLGLPGVTNPDVALSGPGRAGVVVGLWMIALGLAHATQLTIAPSHR